MMRFLPLLALVALGCTSEAPVCYDADDEGRPDGPHLVRNSDGQCVRVEGTDASTNMDATTSDAGVDAIVTEEDGGVRSTRLMNLTVGLPAQMSGTFSPESFIYDVSAPYLAAELLVTATPQDDGVSIEVGGTAATNGEPVAVAVPVGAGNVQIVVSGEGVAPTTYALEISRAMTVANANYFKASNTDSSDRFGEAVGLSGDTLVVGAPSEESNATLIDGNESDNSAGGSGAVYVFRRSAEGWKQEAYIKASNTDAGDRFGKSLAIEGDILAVGAPGEDGNAREINGNADNNTRVDSGAVYIYKRTGDTWAFDSYIKASNADAGDAFGAAVALRDGRLIVGATGEASVARQVGGVQTDNTRADSGAAYVFRLEGEVWTQEVYLKASNADEGDMFGTAVAIDGDVAVVGAEFEASNGGFSGNNDAPRAGAAYVFRFSGNSWSEEEYLKAPNAEEGDSFGISVSLWGTTLVVGAPSEDSSATNVGGEQDDNGEAGSGAAYVFEYTESTWDFSAYLKASNTDGSDEFGNSVSISHGFIASGAPLEQSTSTEINGGDNNDDYVGAAYLFYRDGEAWKPHAYIKPRAAHNDGLFGNSLALDRGRLVVGYQNEPGSGKGVDAPLTPADTSAAGAAFTFE